MKRKFLAFDIETAKILPENYGDLHSHRPLGISCAAVWATDKNKPQTFYSIGTDGNPSPQMSRKDLSDVVDFLLEQSHAGYTIITHNGLGFDFDVLAEESDRIRDCKKLALRHVDMMFHIFCSKGFGVGLEAAAKAFGETKSEGMDGSLVPQLWEDREHQKVLDYVAQDCRLTLDIAEKSEKKGSFRWITQKGKRAFFDIPSGWLTVEDAINIPLPDTSWMDDPWPRSKLSGWLNK